MTITSLSIICCQQHNAYAGNQWLNGTGESTPLGSSNPSDIDTNVFNKIADPNERLLSNYREGCKISYLSASSLTIGAGEIMLSNSDGTIRLMQQNTSDTTATFSNIDTGSEANSTTYYVYATQSITTDTDFDITISLSSSTPSGATYYKRLGSFYNNAAGDIEQISNDDTYMLISTGTLAHGATIPLPSGYSESQCKWIVSYKGENQYEAPGAGTWLGQRCYTTGRVVTVQNWNSYPGVTTDQNANYIIIGYK